MNAVETWEWVRVRFDCLCNVFMNLIPCNYPSFVFLF